MRGSKVAVRVGRWRVDAALSALLSVGMAACTEPVTRTRLTATIDADIPVRALVADVEARIEMSVSGTSWRILAPFHLLPRTSDDWPIKIKSEALTETVGATYQLIAEARDTRGAVLARTRVLASFDEARDDALSVLFDQRCVARDALCGASLTCRDGECVDATFDPAAPRRRPQSAPIPEASGEDPRSPIVDTGGIADENAPCATEGDRRCAGFGSPFPLRCEQGSWKRQAECSAAQRCDSSEGERRGTCQRIAPECAGQQPNVPFCRDEVMRVCDADLIASKMRPCGDSMYCANDERGEPHCVCQRGSVKGAAGCEVAKSCARDNGACDPLTICTDGENGRTCGACPPSFNGTGESGCVPRLTALESTMSPLSPAFASETTEYHLDVPLLVQRITLSVKAPEAASVLFNGAPATEKLSWTSPVLALGENTFEVRVQTKVGVGTAYRIHVERAGKQAAYIKPSTTKAAMQFSGWMALSGDTFVVGAPLENSAATGINGDETSTAAKDSGAAYVFVRTPAGWKQQAYLKPPTETRAQDFFGASVAISGDTLAIGSIRRDLRNAGALPTRNGVVFMYTRSGGVWSFQQELSASDASAGDSCGSSLALDGDKLAVGCPIVGPLTKMYGAVYTFNRIAGTWQEKESQKLVSPRPYDLGQFGSFLSMTGDSLAVSVQEDGNEIEHGGAVYMFTLRDMRWINPQRLEPQPPRAYARFGFETAVLGDQLAIGAPNPGLPDRSDGESGDVWLYQRKADHWENTTVLKAPLAQRGDLYGTGVALAPDTLLISSPGENGGSMGVGGDPNRRDGAQTGAAYLYAYTDDGWKLSTYFKANNPGKSDTFGWIVALGTDFAVIAAPGEDGSGRGIDPNADDSSNDSGAVYVFQ